MNGALANLFGLFVRIGLQVVQVPVFLHFWSTDRFGEWLIVSSIPTYLSLSGLGFGTAAGNAVARLAAQGDQSAVRAILRAAFLISTGSCLIASTAIIGSAMLFDLPPLLGLREIVGVQFVQIALAWCAVILVRMVFGLAETALRAVGRYPTFVMLENVAQILEFAGVVVALVMFGTPLSAIVAMLLVRLAFAVATAIGIRARYRWTIHGEAQPIGRWVRELIRPSLAFLVIPISQSLNLQGTLLVAGHFFGPTGAAVLSTARTLGRLVETGLNMINNVVYEEVGYAAGADDKPGLKRILIHATAASIVVGVGASVFLLLVGPSIYELWTHNKLALNRGVLIAVLAAGVVRSLISSSTALLAGLNRHGSYSVVLLASTVISLVAAVLLESQGLVAVAASALLAEVLVAVHVFPKGLHGAGMTARELLGGLVDPRNYHLGPWRRGRAAVASPEPSEHGTP